MITSTLKRKIILNAKNFVGWKTNRKIVVFSVDDYGNVRLHSKRARQKLEASGIKAKSFWPGFDLYDALETRKDLEMLFETLSSVKDRNNKSAVFTPFAVPCNIDFEAVAELGYQIYKYELLPDTYDKLSAIQPEAYEGAWQLWQQGIQEGLMTPQFHGREHLNLKAFEEKLDNREEDFIAVLKNRSFARYTFDLYPTISMSAAFDFWDFKENEGFKNIVADGLSAFKKVFGYRSVHFNPPGGREHPFIHETLREHGIRYIDTPMIKNEHQGKGKFKKVFNYTGKKNEVGQTYLVRNVVFEPTHPRSVDWVSYAMKQIEAAFRWSRPAIISSHRVNFCGHIDEDNRKKGITALQELLTKITQQWPNVEFMSANELGDLISKSSDNHE